MTLTILGALLGLMLAMFRGKARRWSELLGDSRLAAQQRNPAQAESSLREALRIAESQTGAEWVGRHQATLLALARLLFDNNQHGEAALRAAEYVELVRKNSPESELVAQGLALLADICAAQSKYSEAEALYRTALDLEEKLLGADSIQLTRNLIKLGRLLQDQARRGEAAVLFHRCAEIQEQRLAESR